MSSLNDVRLESNKNVKINFDGGDLSSDSGMLLVKEFANKLGFIKRIKSLFKTKDTAKVRFHKDHENLLQEIFQTIAGYFRENDADELTNDPIFNTILEKDAQASQPTMSRFFNRTDDDTLLQFDNIHTAMRQIVYGVKPPERILFDVDSTNFDAFGKQEGSGYNSHYAKNGYHPLLVFDGLNGDLLKACLRKGTVYTSNGVVDFLRPLLEEYLTLYPSTELYLRGDSGFAVPKLYELLEVNGTSYAIRLKFNNILHDKADFLTSELDIATKYNKVDYAVCYGETMYQAGSWNQPRRVVIKVEKPMNQMNYMYTFIVTNMDLKPEQLIKFYCNRGSMENFIKESKSGFDFDSMSSHDMVVNANRLQISMLAYNLFNWFRRIALPVNMRKYRIDTIRLKLIKVASRVIHSAGYLIFKLCSSCPYKQEFYETLKNIKNLTPMLE